MLFTSNCFGQSQNQLRVVLSEQLKNSHTNEDWYVPIFKATFGLRANEASWKDSSENHSIRQIVSHLSFYNGRVLAAFQGNKVPDFTGENEETFHQMNDLTWDQAVNRLDSIQAKWEEMVEKCSEDQLVKWSSTIANVCSHNAYHTGQIIYIRKRNGWWPKSK